MDELIVSKEEWPYGLRCMSCSDRLGEGAAYSKRLVGIAAGPGDEAASGFPVVEIVCVPCGLGLTSGR